MACLRAKKTTDNQGLFDPAVLPGVYSTAQHRTVLIDLIGEKRKSKYTRVSGVARYDEGGHMAQECS